MNERIKELRKALKLTQSDFGERIGLTRNAINCYERGIANPTGSAIKSICSEFNVSESWLRTGEGDMFASESKQDIVLQGRLLEAYKNSPALLRAIVDSYLSMDSANRRAFESIVSDIETRIGELDRQDIVISEQILLDRAIATREQA